MKKITLLLLSFSFVAVSFGQSKPAQDHSGHDHSKNPHNATVKEEVQPDPATLAKMVFEETEFNFGKTMQGDVVEHTYKFTNEGDVPLVIEGAKSTCGCTVPVFPKDPILPGESGEINVKFNTKGKYGNQRKPINVTANTWPPITTTYLRGIVEKPEIAAPATTTPAPSSPMLVPPAEDAKKKKKAKSKG